MARPRKEGLDYFPKDVDFYEDFKIIELLERHGPVGVAVYDFVLTRIYREGYCLRLPLEKLALLAVRAIGNRWVTKEQAINVITYCGEIGLFRVDLLEQGVFTSAGIQRRFRAATSRRLLHKENEYWILDEKDEEMPESLLNATLNRVSATETPVNVTETPVNVTEMPRKKSKEKKSKEKNNSAAVIVTEMEQCGFQINQHIVDGIMSYVDEYGETWVLEAIRRAADSNVKTLRYVHGILRNWQEKGEMDGRSTKDDGPAQPKYFADEYI